MNVVVDNYAAMLRQAWTHESPERQLLDAVAYDLRTAYDAADTEMPPGLIVVASRIDDRTPEH